MDQNHARPPLQAVIDECLPVLKALAKGRCAVIVGESCGKGTADNRSEIDFSVFYNEVSHDLSNS